MSILDQIQVTLRQPRWRRALAGAALSDGLSFAFALAPPFQLGIDLATAVLLLLLIGWRWGLAAALAVEAIPGLALFPAWTLAVLAYAAAEKKPQYPGLEP